MSRLTAEQLAEEISRFVNGASSDEVKKLVEIMGQDHPTLQQSKMRLSCLFIEEMANKSHTDARNEQSKKTAKALINGYKTMLREQIIKEDGYISESMSLFIDDKAIPSGSLPTI